MKNFSKKNFTVKNIKEYKKNSDSGYYSKNKNRSEENERFMKKSAKNKNVENLNKIHKINVIIFGGYYEKNIVRNFHNYLFCWWRIS